MDKGGVVSGAENQNKNPGFADYNFFPVESAMAAGLMPVRKVGLSDLKLWAGSSVAIDADSGTILHYDDGRKKTQIASLTKMMTATLAMENIKDMNSEITITKDALHVDGTVVGCPTSVFCNGNRMYAGEKVKAIDLMKAMLMNSANDAATALGMYMAGGSADKFVDMMNEKARSLGLQDTHFCTPSGLEIDGKEDQCYSSAYDIARIAAYSMHFDTIWNIMKISDGRFYSTDGKYMHELKNTDMLLATMPSCIGGKTGFTPMAGKSLLIGADDPTGKHKIIAVVLNDEKRWEDMKLLTDWIFQSYTWK
jgi:D-alanyl-D-alanine carboxypeptidase